MSIDLTVIIATIFNVVVLYLFMRRFFFKPLTNFMNNRTKSIEDRIKDSEVRFKDAETARDYYREKLQGAESEGKGIVDEYRSKAVRRSDDIINDAKKEAELIRQRAALDAERELEKAKDEIRRQIVDLSLVAAARSVESQLDENKHHELIKDFISKVGV